RRPGLGRWTRGDVRAEGSRAAGFASPPHQFSTAPRTQATQYPALPTSALSTFILLCGGHVFSGCGGEEGLFQTASACQAKWWRWRVLGTWTKNSRSCWRELRRSSRRIRVERCLTAVPIAALRRPLTSTT